MTASRQAGFPSGGRVGFRVQRYPVDEDPLGNPDVADRTVTFGNETDVSGVVVFVGRRV